MSDQLNVYDHLLAHEHEYIESLAERVVPLGGAIFASLPEAERAGYIRIGISTPIELLDSLFGQTVSQDYGVGNWAVSLIRGERDGILRTNIVDVWGVMHGSMLEKTPKRVTQGGRLLLLAYTNTREPIIDN